MLEVGLLEDSSETTRVLDEYFLSERPQRFLVRDLQNRDIVGLFMPPSSVFVRERILDGSVHGLC